MFRPDVKVLKNFYESALGKVFCRVIRAELRKSWPEISPQETVAGIGFAVCELRMFHSAIALMPGAQGAVKWHGDSVLCEETRLPVADNSIAKAILIHALEYSGQPQSVLREMWRILAPGGRMIIIVPNAAGMWARFGRTPLQRGRVFSRLRLETLINDGLFRIINTRSAVHIPPTNSRFALKNFKILEAIGKKLWGGCGGVIMIEAEKTVYALAKKPEVQPIKSLVIAERMSS
jgi:SAM-dependent methyltransferase